MGSPVIAGPVHRSRPAARAVRGAGRRHGLPPRPEIIRSAALLASFLLTATAAAQPRDRRLEELTLEELMRVEVTTVAGQPQARFTSPSAIFVITAEDIRRSGHRTVAEALRLVPGMFVGRSGASGWVIGARGLTGNNLTSTRSLVLVDGRIVYDPLFNGTLWDVVDVVLEDIDRIEVIRGPGATLWGANAMNGVINVITRSAFETEGTAALAGGGDLERLFTSVRHGESFGDDRAWRVWAKYSDNESLESPDGGSARDEWTRARGGFRFDAVGGSGVTWTLQGDVYGHPTTSTATSQPVPGRHLERRAEITDDDVDGGYVLFRAQSGQGGPSGWSLQGYYDRTDRETSRIDLFRDTVDLDFRTWRKLRERHELVWGVQVNSTEDRLVEGPTFLFEPLSRSWTTVNAFAQLTAPLVPERLFAMVGSKLTHHDFVGFEAQPGVRLWWTPDDRRTFWAAVSRPVRVPSRLEEDGLIVFAYADPGLIGGGPATGTILPFGLGGDRGLESEELLASELGYRQRIGEAWELDSTLFFHDYSTLITIPDSVVGTFNNLGSGESWGGDLALTRAMSDGWRLTVSYSHLRVAIDGPVLATEEDSVPENSAQLRSSWDVSGRLELHGALYYVDRVPVLADAYERLDLGLTWRPRPGVELAAWGQNLSESDHSEASAVRIPRSVYGQLRVTF